MGLFDKIKAWFFYRFLKKSIDDGQRTKKVFNLMTATSIGIIYDASVPSNSIIVTTFVEKLRVHGKKVFSLAYMNDTKAESNEIMKLFNKASLNWYKIPRIKEVDEFIKQPMDILIAVHTKESLPLQYIAAHSNAKFRMGPYFEKAKTSYDWMIHSEKDLSVESYLKQVEFYLNSINS